jgi:hypothetical protein
MEKSFGLEISGKKRQDFRLEIFAPLLHDGKPVINMTEYSAFTTECLRANGS